MRDFALEVYFARWQKLTRHHLTASDCETLTLAELLALASAEDRRQWETLPLGYGDPQGNLSLREAIAAAYHRIPADDILCFAGAQEAIHTTLRALLGPDDHAIIVVPNYQSTETIPLGLCATTGVALDPRRRWSLDIDAVASAIRPNTKVVAINFPNNPTGKILEREQFDMLVSLCRRHGIWLFSDEVYRLIERDPAMRLPTAADAYERGISIAALSKSYGLPGLRVGWIACRDRTLLQRIGRVKHYFSISNAAPSEILARIALGTGDAILRRNRGIAAQNLVLLNDFFGANGDLFDWEVPDGGVVGYPRYKGGEGVEAFCARLIEEEGVLLLPASLYRSELLATPTDHFRIGFGRSDLAQGLDVMAACLRSRPTATFRGADLRASSLGCRTPFATSSRIQPQCQGRKPGKARDDERDGDRVEEEIHRRDVERVEELQEKSGQRGGAQTAKDSDEARRDRPRPAQRQPQRQTEREPYTEDEDEAVSALAQPPSALPIDEPVAVATHAACREPQPEGRQGQKGPAR